MKKLIAVVSTVVLLSVGAFGFANAATKKPVKAAKVKTVSIEVGNLFFKPKVINLKLNEKVTLNFANNGGHTFTVAGLGINVPLNGPKGTVTFTPKKKGTFEVLCAVPGHKGAGMIGQIVVK